MIDNGFRPVAAAAARMLAGRPTRDARSRYAAVSPYGIAAIALQTSRWNAVPAGDSATVNAVRAPAMYSEISTPARTRTGSLGLRSHDDATVGS